VNDKARTHHIRQGLLLGKVEVFSDEDLEKAKAKRATKGAARAGGKEKTT
jgi:hypothetical protein